MTVLAVKSNPDIAVIRVTDGSVVTGVLELDGSDAVPRRRDSKVHWGMILSCPIQEFTSNCRETLVAEHSQYYPIMDVTAHHFQLRGLSVGGNSASPVISKATRKVIGIVIEKLTRMLTIEWRMDRAMCRVKWWSRFLASIVVLPPEHLFLPVLRQWKHLYHSVNGWLSWNHTLNRRHSLVLIELYL